LSDFRLRIPQSAVVRLFFYSFRKPAPEKEQVLCLPSFHGCPIEDERLLSALKNLSDADLELITLYAYEEHDTVEIPWTPHPGRNEPGG